MIAARARRDRAVARPLHAAEAGICLDLIRRPRRNPDFGVCLGHQAIGEAFGGEVVRAPVPVHGKSRDDPAHGARRYFAASTGRSAATRYHSLVVKRDRLPDDLKITAETDDGLVMALSHRRRPVHGVQFHPESIASEHGHRILGNFLDLAARMERSDARRRRACRRGPHLVTRTNSLIAERRRAHGRVQTLIAKVATAQA